MIFSSKAVNPDISRNTFVHLQGTPGRSCTPVPQAPDNAANGRMHFAPRVKIFQASFYLNKGNKVYLLFLG